jgi:hypothetical protein
LTPRPLPAHETGLISARAGVAHNTPKSRLNNTARPAKEVATTFLIYFFTEYLQIITTKNLRLQAFFAYSVHSLKNVVLQLPVYKSWLTNHLKEYKKD